METINGEWYMSGCSPTAPNCLHDTVDLIALIHRIGFIPLFENSIPGFSVEENTPADFWWTGDSERDPWEWRMILARDPEIAYGKMFHRRAGFISKEWFPAFANYRRNGYDFDALYEDGMASYRAKAIMDVFALDEKMTGREIMSYDIKAEAGFGKGGHKNFEGVLTDLQIQTYLIMSDFRQKKNKLGQEYGWHIAAFETPETKWGYENTTALYKEDPSESWGRILGQMRIHFPDADEKEIRKVLGLRR